MNTNPKVLNFYDESMTRKIDEASNHPVSNLGEMVWLMRGQIWSSVSKRNFLISSSSYLFKILFVVFERNRPSRSYCA